jgi:hypothetical protein
MWLNVLDVCFGDKQEDGQIQRLFPVCSTFILSVQRMHCDITMFTSLRLSSSKKYIRILHQFKFKVHLTLAMIVK